MWKNKGLKVTKTILKKNIKQGVGLPNRKIYLKALVCYWLSVK